MPLRMYAACVVYGASFIRREDITWEAENKVSPTKAAASDEHSKSISP